MSKKAFLRICLNAHETMAPSRCWSIRYRKGLSLYDKTFPDGIVMLASATVCTRHFVAKYPLHFSEHIYYADLSLKSPVQMHAGDSIFVLFTIN